MSIIKENLPQKLKRKSESETYEINDLDGDYIFFLMYDNNADKGNIEVYDSKNQPIETFKNRDNNFALGRAVNLCGTHYFKVSHVTGKVGSLYTVCVVRLSKEVSNNITRHYEVKSPFDAGRFDRKLECSLQTLKVGDNHLYLWPQEDFTSSNCYYFFAIPLPERNINSSLNIVMALYSSLKSPLVSHNENKISLAEGFYYKEPETQLMLLVSQINIKNTGRYIVGWGKD